MSEATLTLLLQSVVNGLLIGGIYALLAIGLTMTFGVLNIVNLAHGEFTMLGMYAAFFAFTLLGIDPYVLLIVALPAFFLLGLVVERFLIEPIVNAAHSIQILLATGLSLVIQNLALFLWTANFRSIRPLYADLSLQIGGVGISIPRVAALVVALLLSGLLYLALRHTDLGKAVRACANQREAAYLCGINVRRIYGITFGIGTACAAAAGILIMPFFFAYPTVGSTLLLTGFVIVILGGMGNFAGALVGGFIVGLGEAFGELVIPGSMKQLVTYAILVLVLLVRPTGLFKNV
ncbi:MAG: branched-chain amino acid ABC transporter permease [Chloroflexi bacterium]|nr:branched-chain amino acid ABC transporter permease [Chloroflexota bacterium]